MRKVAMALCNKSAMSWSMSVGLGALPLHHFCVLALLPSLTTESACFVASVDVCQPRFLRLWLISYTVFLFAPVSRTSTSLRATHD